MQTQLHVKSVKVDADPLFPPGIRFFPTSSNKPFYINVLVSALRMGNFIPELRITSFSYLSNLQYFFQVVEGLVNIFLLVSISSTIAKNLNFFNEFQSPKLRCLMFF